MNHSQIEKCCAFEAPILDQVLPPILILEFMFGLLGNFVALWMFIFHMDTWRPNSVYLTHLAVADSIVLFCLPFRADYYRRGKNWLYGDALCRILLFLLAANRAAGIFFLTAVAVDRYFKIVHPLNPVNRMGLGYALWVSLGLWGLIFLATGYLLADEHFFYNSNRTQSKRVFPALLNAASVPEVTSLGWAGKHETNGAGAGCHLLLSLIEFTKIHKVRFHSFSETLEKEPIS
ncbi:hypothetical protein WMY93_020821 [Mugilogobius chulae]|uniref:G-protein coupled receptors family 1 profile domain-containing protein n=1 Tax=Mugilogobius chulae TaxID=88201 RepID=A0AAW0NL87_9GOBI